MAEMTLWRETKILQAAIDKYGKRGQVIVAIEEMAELTKALTKWLRYYKNDKTVECAESLIDNIHEEMADVSIMLNQLSLIFGEAPEIEIEKLERLESRINN